MLSADLLACDVVAGELQPAFLTREDHPWLRELLEQVRALDGRPRRELWSLITAFEAGPARKRRMVGRVIDRLCKDAPPRQPRARSLRRAYFLRAQSQREQGEPFAASDASKLVAAQLGCTTEQVVEGLFGDLAAERPLRMPAQPFELGELALRTNLALGQGLLRRALGVKLRVTGHARAVVRQAKLRRLLCTVRRVAGATLLELDGAYALFRRTIMYGRALASLLGVLKWCPRFALQARCLLEGEVRLLRLDHTAPVFPGSTPRPYDSKLERSFARHFRKRAEGYELIREPEPVEAGGTLIFPDFAIRRRSDPRRSWLVEIIGFWTADYLRKKLARLGRLPLGNWILCVDERLACSAEEFPKHASLLQFRRNITANTVEAVMELVRSGSTPPSETQDADASERPGPGERRTVLGVGDLFVDYAGRRPAGDPIHVRLAALRPGAVLDVVECGPRLLLSAGGEVAALSSRACKLWRPRLGAVDSVRVLEVRTRRREQSGLDYRHLLRMESWLLPLVEVSWLEKGAPPAAARAPARIAGPRL